MLARTIAEVNAKVCYATRAVSTYLYFKKIDPISTSYINTSKVGQLVGKVEIVESCLVELRKVYLLGLLPT